METSFFHNFSPSPPLPLSNMQMKFERKRSRKNRKRISMTTYRKFAESEVEEDEEQKHYLQFNFTYDYFVFRSVPIMLKLWIIWCYRRGNTSVTTTMRHVDAGTHCRCKYIKNYFNIKTCFDMNPQKRMNNKEAFGLEDTGSLANT